MTYIEGPAAQSPEWHAMRRFDPQRKERPVVIGASEAAAAMGLSKYQSPLELYLVKRGEYEPEISQEQRDRMDYGTFMEPLILERYARPTGIMLQRGWPMCFSATHPFCVATPDAVAPGVNWIVEAKTASPAMRDSTGEKEDQFGEEGTDQVPIQYIIQCQQLMHVFGCERVDVPVLFDSTTLRVYRVNRDNDLIASMLDAEEELCHRIIIGDPPEPMFEHPGTLRLLQKTRKHRSWVVKSWSQEEAEAWLLLQKARERVRELELLGVELEARVFDSFGDAGEAVCGDLKVIRKKNAKGHQSLRQIGTTTLCLEQACQPQN